MTHSTSSFSGALTIRDYDELIATLKARADACGLATGLLDELTGLPSGYVGKLFGPARVKRIGLDSLWLLVDVLALKITIEPDLEAARRWESRWEKRDEISRRPGILRKRFSPELRAKVMSEIGRIGGAKRKRFRITEKQRRRINSRNAKRGWETRRNRANGAPAVGQVSIACRSPSGKPLRGGHCGQTASRSVRP